MTLEPPTCPLFFMCVCVCVCVRARIEDTCMHVCVCIEDIYTRQGTTTNTFAKTKREDGL